MSDNEDRKRCSELYEKHRLTLDCTGTAFYKKAIFNNRKYFKNKIILDVGAGAGIISMFCARAGARKVFAVEDTDLASTAKKVVRTNRLNNIVKVITGKIEEIELPNNIKVDAIVSQWMGFHLVEGWMLESVLFARDKFLKEDGKMFPESAAMYVAPCSAPPYFEPWEFFHGFLIDEFSAKMRRLRLNTPDVMHVPEENVLGEPLLLASINLKEIKITDLDCFFLDQNVVCVDKDANYQGVCIWFECMFPQMNMDIPPVKLCTSPFSPLTHWKQSVLLLRHSQTVEKGDAVAFDLLMYRNLIEKRYNFQFIPLNPNHVRHPVPCFCNADLCVYLSGAVRNNHEGVEEAGNEYDAQGPDNEQ